MISAESLPSNLRRAIARKHEKVKPMKNWIILNSFSVLSFDVIVRQSPVRVMHCLQPMPVHTANLTQDGHLPVEALSPVVSVKTSRHTQSDHRNSIGRMRMKALMPRPSR